MVVVYISGLATRSHAFRGVPQYAHCFDQALLVQGRS